MLLKVGDRLLLLNVLPNVGSFETLKIVRDLQAALSFSEEEHKALDITSQDGMVQWRQESDHPVDIPIGEIATKVIIERLKEMDKRKQLKIEALQLYERFVLGEGKEEEQGV